MEYNFREIEKKWQQRWREAKVYEVSNHSPKPKFYVLDMFPYPSGAGLHVGHPLGYIASDIFARYKTLKGFNVLHPMGYDAFGLPAEQYAVDHGVHPAVSTEENINTFRSQLENIGFSFDWSREVRTSDPGYYKWTQWIFLQLFDSWYNRKSNRAERIDTLIRIFETQGNIDHPIPGSLFQEIEGPPEFSAEDWRAFDEFSRQSILMEYRLAYCGYGEVNWCEALGTVLANDEVINGVSERGGFPVEKRKLRQWYLRITEYADRLLEGLDQVDFSESLKEQQRNWIGKSEGAEIAFEIVPNAFAQAQSDPGKSRDIRVYTTRPDTIFGVDFMVLAPEHELVNTITTSERRNAVEQYLEYVKSRNERERMAEKQITGEFTGAYVIHPFTKKQIPVWISEYVLAGYGTGAIMAVPCGDERDHKFARHFNIPITNIIGAYYNGQEANPTKEAILQNSGFLDGLVMRDAIPIVIKKLEAENIGFRKVNYKMRDAAFSRQRYWGEPFPIYWKNDMAHPLPESALPITLPHIDEIKPGPEGEGPLANLEDWVTIEVGQGEARRETNTMPGYAGSSWYFLRYMDPHNQKEFCSRQASDYWGQVDLYIGGTEHAVGHLLYSRMWTKALYDLGYIGHEEPYKRLVNQGKIGGDSKLVYRVRGSDSLFVTADFEKEAAVELNGKKVALKEVEFDELHVDVNLVEENVLDVEKFRQWKPEYANARFIFNQHAKYITGSRLEKMSKRYFNVVNPDDIVRRYGSDTFRMYEMFLGPVEQDKPWDTKGIEGVHRFLKKLWRLFVHEAKGVVVVDDPPNESELKALNKAIKKIEDDTERFSFNTAVSTFMILVNELSELKCHKKDVLRSLLVALAPYAPHIAEELWHVCALGEGFIVKATFPHVDEKYLQESSKNYPIAINGKTRTELNIALDATQQQVEDLVLTNAQVKRWMEGKQPKKVVYVKGKMINVVV